MLKYHNGRTGKIAEAPEGSVNITSADDMLQLMVDAGYTYTIEGMIVHQGSLPPEFFDLKTGIAGEILQKFSNYRMRLCIIGDFSGIKSKSLRDFIRESNKRRIISFVSGIDEALRILEK